MEGITCTQTKTITIKKVKDTSYHLCISFTPTDTVNTDPSPAIKSNIFEGTNTFKILNGTNYRVAKWTLESEPKTTIYWLKPTISASDSTDKKDMVFLVDTTTQNESEEGKIKKLILKIEQFREEQLLNKNTTDTTVDSEVCAKKNKKQPHSNQTPLLQLKKTLSF